MTNKVRNVDWLAALLARVELRERNLSGLNSILHAWREDFAQRVLKHRDLLTPTQIELLETPWEPLTADDWSLREFGWKYWGDNPNLPERYVRIWHQVRDLMPTPEVESVEWWIEQWEKQKADRHTKARRADRMSA